MFSKPLRFLPILLLLLTLSFPACADGFRPNTFFAADADGNREEVPLSMACSGGALYLLCPQTLYRYPENADDRQIVVDWSEILSRLDTGQPREELLSDFSRTRIDSLIGTPDALYGLNRRHATLHRLTGGGFEPWLTLDAEKSCIAESEGDVLLLDGHLLYLVPSPDADAGDRLFDYDLTTHEVAACDAGDVRALSCGPDRQIALLRASQTSDGGLEIVLRDLRAGAAGALAVGDTACALCYDASQNRLLFLQDGEVHALDTSGKVDSLGFLPVSSGGPDWRMCALPDGSLALLTPQAVHVRRPSARAPSSSPLRVMLHCDALLPSFLAAHPEWDVQCTPADEATASELVLAFLSGTLEQDVIELDASILLRSLAQRGYLADLSSVDSLVSDARLLYPAVQDAVMVRSALIAVPASLTVSSWAYDRERWDAVYPGRTPPQTVSAFLKLCESWLSDVESGKADGPLVYTGTSFFEELYADLLDLYLVEYDRESSGFSFDTPVFRSALEKARALESRYAATAAQAAFPDDRQPLLHTRYIGHLQRDVFAAFGAWDPLLPPVFDPDHAPVVPGQLTVYAVNAATPHLDAALRFLEHAVQSRGTALERLLNPQANEPVQRPQYEQEREALRNSLDSLYRRRAAADESERAEIEQTIALQERLWETGAQNRWLISAEEIAAYRSIARQLVVRDTALSALQRGPDFQSLYSLILQYAHGSIDLDGCIRQMDSRIRLALLEQE